VAAFGGFAVTLGANFCVDGICGQVASDSDDGVCAWSELSAKSTEDAVTASKDIFKSGLAKSI
jgi:hypothetical protein